MLLSCSFHLIKSLSALVNCYTLYLVSSSADLINSFREISEGKSWPFQTMCAFRLKHELVLLENSQNFSV